MNPNRSLFGAVVAILVATGACSFATNQAILFELSDELPGSRVLEHRWGAEQLAAGIPKGRDRARPFVDAFVHDATRDGTVARAIVRARLRGVAGAGGS